MTATKTGILLVNLGTPDSPKTGDVRRYLREFLSDPRVIEVWRPLWWLILNLVILVIRPPRSAKAYRQVWDHEGEGTGSPLLHHMQGLTKGLRQSLAMPVELGMCYGQPSIGSAIDRLMQQGCERIIVLPAYPQYSATTTAAVYDAVGDHLKTLRVLPELTYIRDYHDDENYIDALAQSVLAHRIRNDFPDKLLLSFHGIPQRYVEAGDPYFDQCQRTAELLREKLELTTDRFFVSFQSRVGREPWLQPYTDKTLEQWGPDGEIIDVMCPGFSVDCLETIEEIDDENREIFMDAGGSGFRYIPCLNATPAHVAVLSAIIGKYV